MLLCYVYQCSTATYCALCTHSLPSTWCTYIMHVLCHPCSNVITHHNESTTRGWKNLNIWHAMGLWLPPHESLGTMKPEGCEGRMMRGSTLIHRVISSDYLQGVTAAAWFPSEPNQMFSQGCNIEITRSPAADALGCCDLMMTCRQINRVILCFHSY